MFALLRRRSFALFWTGGLVSAVGDWALLIALPFYLYGLTGSVLATGGMVIARTLPGLLFGSVAGVFVDRWDRRRTMILTDLARAAILLVIPLVQSADGIWIIYLAIFAQSTLSQFFDPAHSALLPRLVRDDELVTANSLDSMNWEVARLIAPPIGGLLMSTAGLPASVLIDSATYVFSALMLVFVAVPATPVLDTTAAPAGPEGPTSRLVAVWEEWWAGLRLVGRHRLIRTIFLVIGFAMIGEGLGNVVAVIFVQDVLHGGPLEQGWLATAQAVGGLLGGVLLSRVGPRLSPVTRVSLGGVALGAAFLITVAFPIYGLVLALRVVMGVAVIALFVTLVTMLQQSAEDRYRGRIFGAFGTVIALTTLVGQVLASAVGDLVGPSAVVAMLGCVYIGAGLLAAVLLREGRAPRPAAPAVIEADLAPGPG
jgi:MFS family permease